LTLAAGTIIKNDSGGALHVDGTLIANGTQEHPVVFTSLKDDEFGGDTNGDGDTTRPAAGDWTGIFLSGVAGADGIGQFTYARVLYGGNSAGDAQANVYFYSSDEGYFLNSVSQYSATMGLRFVSAADITVRSSWITHNAGYGIYISGAPVPDLGSDAGLDPGLNIIRSNNDDIWQLYNNSANEVWAISNDWGRYTNAEIDSCIFDDEESTNSGVVHFLPWWQSLPAPTLISINTTETTVSLEWEPVTEADGYTVYSSTQPYHGFVVDESGEFTGETTWAAPRPAEKRFYRVVAIQEATRREK